ncbi:unnamed protein product [Paramecium pentaurelia]|uniref:Uncharacterized protein n=1 Tax=Paramecium pentaurelia TaxID=43138 RepID=A0A8S1YFZ8_9CILI|nr:unnamed protein product [Paramecium pentaurelia]
MITTFGIPFSEYQEQANNLPTLLPIDQRFILELITATQYNQKQIQVKAQLIYNTYINIPQFYFTLQDCESSDYIPIHEFIQDETEQQNFIKDINPATGIAMITMHNCLLSEFIHFVSEGKSFLLTLISYYFSKLHIYIKKSEYQE